MTDMDKALALCPIGQATATAVSGRLSDAATLGGHVLADGDKLYIPPGVNVTFDIQTPKLKWLRVDGSFTVQPDATTRLWCETVISAMGSTLTFGQDSAPITGQFDLVFADFGPLDFVADPWALVRGLIPMGAFMGCGATRTARARTLGNKVGDTVVEFQVPVVGWSAGDPIVMAGTSCIANEDEELTITSVAADGLSIDISPPLKFDHSTLSDPKTGLFREMFVINRSKRHVHFTSESTDPTRFGHVMFMNGNMTDLCHSSLVNLGRTDKSKPVTDPDGAGNGLANPRGRYMVHSHINGGKWADTPTQFEALYLEGSPGWGLVNHASYVKALGCAAYKIFGSHFVGEDGAEIGEFRECSALRTTNLQPTVDLGQPSSAISDFAQNGHGIWTHCGGLEIYDCDVAGFPLSHGVFLMGFPAFLLPPAFTTPVAFPHTNLKVTPNDPQYTTNDVPPPLVPQTINGLNVFACSTAFEPWQVGLNITPSQAPVKSSQVSNFWLEASSIGANFGYMTWMEFHNGTIPDPVANSSPAFAATGHSGFTGGLTWDNCSIGLAVPGRQRWPTAMPGWTNQTTTITNCAIRAVNGIEIPQLVEAFPRTITIDAATTWDCTGYTVRLRAHQIAVNPYISGPVPFLGNVAFFWGDDVTKLGNSYLHYPECADSFPFDGLPNVPTWLDGLTNGQAWEKYHLRLGDRLLPADAVPGTNGIDALVSASPATVLEPLQYTEATHNGGESAQTVSFDGPCYVKDAQGNWFANGPYTYAQGLNCPQVVVNGVQRGVLLTRIADGPVSSIDPTSNYYGWWQRDIPPATVTVQPALPLPDLGSGPPPPPPAPTISITAIPATGQAPLSVTFTATVTNTDTVAWAFGDGSSSAGLTVTHTYAAGDFVASAVAIGAGGKVSTTVAVHVTPPPPTGWTLTITGTGPKPTLAWS